MSLLDPNNPNGPLGFIFGAKPAAGIPTYEQLQMRRKIAESLLGQRSRYPRTFGEGLGAIGEAIGDRGMMNKLDAMEAAKGAQDTASEDQWSKMTTSPATATARPMSYAPEDAGTPASASMASGDPWAARSAAIAGIESGGAKDPYSLVGAATRTGDRAHGKYQVMGANVPDWTAAATGTAMTPQQFLANPDAQEAVFKHRFGGYVDKYGEEGAAKAWFGGERGMNNPNATDIHGRLTVRDYGQDYLKRLGPRSDVVDPGLNQSVALDQAAPSAPSGPPMAFSGQPASDAPPVGMPPAIAGQTPPPPPDARAAIAGALAPKPPPVVAPPMPPAPAPVQIAQAPPQQQIRVPEKELKPPTPPQPTDRMRFIEKTLATTGDPLQRDKWTKRYQQEVLEQQTTYKQKQEEYEYKRRLKDEAPQKAATLAKSTADAEEARLRADELRRTGGLGSKALLEPVVASQKAVAGVPAATQALRNARATLESGTFTGAGAEQKLAIAKSKEALASMLGLDANDPKIANTEAFKAAIAPLIAQQRSALAGNANISDADIAMAKAAAGGDITLDAKTFPKVLDAMERINLALAVGHQAKVAGAAAGDETATKALHGVYGLPMEEIIPPRFIQRLKERGLEVADDFDKKFKTPGLARKILGK